MPITGTFVADFKSFFTACDTAQQELKDVAKEASAVSTATSRMATTSTADMASLGASATTTTSKMDTFTTGVRTADKTLSQFGVNLSSEIQALNELSEVSGKTASQIGLIGTASLAAAAGLAGWKIGGWINDLTGADKALGDLLVTMGLYGGDTETAAAKQDVINRAIAAGAPVTITYTEAIKVNTAAHQAFAESHNTASARLGKFMEAIAHLNSSGQLEQLRADLALGTKTAAELDAQYKVTAGTVAWFAAQADAAAAKQKAAADKVAAAAKVVADAQAQLKLLSEGYAAVLATINPAIVTQGVEFLKLGASLSTVQQAYSLTNIQAAALNARFIEMTTGINNVSFGLDSLGGKLPGIAMDMVASFDRVMAASKAAADRYTADVQAMLDAADAANAAIATGFQGSTSAVEGTTRATYQLIQSMDAAGAAAMSLYEKMQAAYTIDKAYEQAGLFVHPGVMNTAGQAWYQQARNQDTQYGTGYGINMNVNVRDAQGAADSIVSNMRSQGVRFA